MTNLSPAAQAVLDAAYQEIDYVPQKHIRWAAAAALHVLVNQVVPQEDEAPRAVFQGKPTLENKDGTFRYDHGQYLRRQFDQDKLDIRWEQRQQTRAMMLAIVTELGWEIGYDYSKY